MQTITITNSLGHQVEVFKGDQIARHIEKFGLYEKDKLSVLLLLLGEMDHPVVLDIGANIGNHSLAFATCADTVLAFEPVPEIFKLLKHNVERNSLTNIRPFNLALSDKQEITTIYLGKADNLGMSSFEQRESSGKSVEISSVIGDEFLQTTGIDKVDMLKIDVEGHEYFVIRGLMKTIERHNPVITLEWNDISAIERFAGSPEYSFLQSRYDFLGLGTNHDRTVWADKPFSWCKRKFNRWFVSKKPVIHRFNPQWRYDNILLFPKGSHWKNSLPSSLFD